MRVAIITESFLPDVNGVAHCVAHVAEHLVSRGHEPIVIAPAPASGHPATAGRLPYPLIRVPSVPIPGRGGMRLGVPGRRVAAALREHGTELVHLASPFVLGGPAGTAARALGLPTVAMYQLDVPAYARVHRLGWGEAAAWRWLRRIHNCADRTLAPSTAAATALLGHGIHRVWLWRRGIDAARFDPVHRSESLRRALAPDGQILVGYVGRLAAEKRVHLLARVARLSGVRLVIVGTGPYSAALRRALPQAVFLGERRGAQLARIYASLDVFVHPGPYETFGQPVQEAQASGVPVVAVAAGGPLDIVTPSRTGFLVPPEDAGALSSAVAALAGDARLRAEFGRAARAQVTDRTWDTAVEDLVNHYLAVTPDAARLVVRS
jgi:phosphatidylinositol alpha 1,6-mannosyltransferase